MKKLTCSAGLTNVPNVVYPVNDEARDQTLLWALLAIKFPVTLAGKTSKIHSTTMC